ncbi:hypothetical protein ABZ863_16795 [Saccharomonospora sp. NPDC046836]|uniref:hypothetical protein n=1 Tax=Saccharomonospora sp. NPDC046836 TaxID=3156921 RepID=UPI0033CBC96E
MGACSTGARTQPTITIDEANRRVENLVPSLDRSAREPASTDWISVTCNEVQHLLATLVITPTKETAYGCASPSGADDINTGPDGWSTKVNCEYA